MLLLYQLRKLSTFSINHRMKAWELYSYGEIRNLTKSTSIVTPSVKNPNEVLVKVEAASLNPIDLKLIEGYGASLFKIVKQVQRKPEFPLIIGRDFSGHVVKVGRNVKKWKVGTPVIGSLWPFESGCMSDYVTCYEGQLANKPTNLTMEQAASIPYAGLTAYSGLVTFGDLKAGNAGDKSVLIIGSNGGVGTIGVQIVKYLGAQHLAVMCSEENADLMNKLGVDAIHGTSSNSINTRYDLILDCTGDNMTKYRALLKPGYKSRYVTLQQSFLSRTDVYGPLIGLPLSLLDLSSNWLKNAQFTQGSQYHWGFFSACGSNLQFLSNLAEKGHLDPVIDSVVNFDDLPSACKQLQKGGVKGKIVVKI